MRKHSADRFIAAKAATTTAFKTTTTTSKAAAPTTTASSGSSGSSGGSGSYVTRSGTKFNIDGHVGYYAGTNAYWIGFLTNNADVDKVMADVAAVSVILRMQESDF